MTPEQANELAQIFRTKRIELGLSARRAAALAGVSHGTLHLLEHGATLAPRPDILKRVALALDLQLTDLLAIVDGLAPGELPSIKPYLRAKYGLGSADAAEIDGYLTRLQARRGGGSGPVGREDEH